MSDDEEGSYRNKNTVFSKEERKLLLLLVNQHYDVVTNKRVDTSSLAQKHQAWEQITKEYMKQKSLVKFPRSQQQLKRCWENMKCKAKKGDPVSAKLLSWGESQARLLKSDIHLDKIANGSLVEFLIKDENVEYCSMEDKSTNEEDLDQTTSLENDINDSTNNTEMNNKNEKTKYSKCFCHDDETKAKLNLLYLERQQKKEIHNSLLQLHKEELKMKKELHKLAVHEMTLRVENERRRAEILERELGNS